SARRTWTGCASARPYASTTDAPGRSKDPAGCTPAPGCAARELIRKRPAIAGRSLSVPAALEPLHGVSLPALLAPHDLEGHLLPCLQALEARGLDGAEVDEHVLAVLAADEAKALGIVEPLDGSGLSVGHRRAPWSIF